MHLAFLGTTKTHTCKVTQETSPIPVFRNTTSLLCRQYSNTFQQIHTNQTFPNYHFILFYDAFIKCSSLSFSVFFPLKPKHLNPTMHPSPSFFAAFPQEIRTSLTKRVVLWELGGIHDVEIGCFVRICRYLYLEKYRYSHQRQINEMISPIVCMSYDI